MTGSESVQGGRGASSDSAQPGTIRAGAGRAGTDTADEPYGRWVKWLFGALVVTVAARFIRLDIDPPYGIVSDGGEFMSDEGWYTQSAQLRANFGTWTSQYDPVWFYGSALFALLESIAFRIAGVSLVVARSVSVFWSCVSLAAFYAILRTVQPRAIALAACLLAAIGAHTVCYSRLAVVEPTGIAVSMLALLAWVRLPRGVAACVVSLAVATAGYFVKSSFVFTLGVLGVLSAWEMVVLARERKWLRAAAILAVLVALPFVIPAVQREINSVGPDQARLFQKWHVDWRVHALTEGDNLVLRELKFIARAYVKLPLVTNAIAIATVAVVAGAALLWQTKFRPRVPRSRASIALIAWGLAGTTFFGLFNSQPIRYFGYAIFPLAFVAVMLLREAVPARRWPVYVLCLVGAHAGTQIPQYAHWLSRPDLTTGDRAARDAVSRMDLTGAADGVGVIGDTSSFLSFFDPRIRPLTFRSKAWLVQRVERWRPRYLFDLPDHVGDFEAECRGLVERLEPMGSYRIMDNYCTWEDFRLYRIVYR